MIPRTPIAPRASRCAQLLMAAGVTLAALAGANAPVDAQTKTAEFQTAAPFAILIDADTGGVLFERNADELMYPSSMAKLMTAELVYRAIKEGRLRREDEITITEDAWRRGGAPSGGSTMYAALGSRVKVDDLIRGMVIQSGNDSCIALAEALAGSEATFAAMMTKRARELGMPKSNFTNSTGLPSPDMQTTARELAHLARHIIATYPDFYELYAQREFTWNKIRQSNRNPLLAMGLGADGLKTGYTREAGYGLVGSALQNGVRLIAVVNGLKSSKERADESRKLIEWGFRGFESRQLFAAGESVGEAKLYGGARGRVPLVAERPVRVLFPRGSAEKLSARVVYQGPVRAPIAKDQPVGTLKVWRGDHLTLEVPVRAAESIGQGTIPQRAFDAAAELLIGLFRAGAERI